VPATADENLWLHRYAALLALTGLLSLVTSFWPALHREIGFAAGGLTLGLVAWLAVREKRSGLRRLGWVLLVAVIAESWLGTLPSSPGVGILHACLAQLFFAATVSVVVFTSRRWNRGPDPVQDSGWPSLRSLAVTTPSLVFVQIALGAAFRHKAMGVLSHVGFAMIVAILNLMAGIFVIQQFPAHRALRPAAIVMLVITFLQLFLGVTVISLASIFPETAPSVSLSVAAHMGLGGLTLASSLVLGILIRRNVRPRTA
jgi:heme A synthase